MNSRIRTHGFAQNCRRPHKISTLVVFAAIVWAGINAFAAESEWVHPGRDGKLIYKTTPAGDRIMDFSHAGYMGGGVALPNVVVKRTVKPSSNDDTAAIQTAINE